MSRFDAAYYRQFYQDQPVHTAREIAELAKAVHHLCKWWKVPVTSVLDVGAGPGFWRDWYQRHHPHVKVVSTDVSPHACKTYGHLQRDISRWSPRGKYDLVICHSVLQYLTDQEASRALENLTRATRHVLYLEVPTREDLSNVLDDEATDFKMRLRPASWYRKRLKVGFRQAGAGLWIAHSGEVVLYTLEAAATSEKTKNN